MPLHHEGPPFPNKNSNSMDQDKSRTSFPPSAENQLYLNQSHPHLYDTELREHQGGINSSETMFPAYPESSQRTLIRDDSYSVGYKPGTESRYADTARAREGASGVYENFMGTNFGQAVPTTQVPLATNRRQVTKKSDVYAFPVESSGMLPRPLPGATKYLFPEETQYSDSDDGSPADSPPPPSSLDPQRSHHPIPFQTHRRSPKEFDEPFFLPAGYKPQYDSYTHPTAHMAQPPNTALNPPSTSSIPMRNSPGVWSSAPLGSAVKAHSLPQHLPRRVSKRSSTHMTSGMDSPSLNKHSVSHVGHPIPDVPPSSSSAASSSDPPSKKKKIKMHECEVCGKQFPRPSGLRTHMNTHNNVKRRNATAYACVFPGCSRAFAVRSNATRHLRTHGAIPESLHPTSPAYEVQFNTPTVVPPSLSLSTIDDEMEDMPYHIRWMPLSLTSRTNARALTSISDAEYDSDDPLEVSESIDWSDTNAFEECNSYLNAKPYPYHPLQFTILPGPAVHRPIPTSHGSV